MVRGLLVLGSLDSQLQRETERANGYTSTVRPLRKGQSKGHEGGGEGDRYHPENKGLGSRLQKVDWERERCV